MEGMANPAIVTVDDDPAVSRAVARDVRRRYGEEYRVVRADSGSDALDALREIKLRGEQVAVLLADYRMPQMNGIQFLEAAMDLFPAARRVLLTAYADTEAAIDAINLVDVDHYLLKPWHPPEEKLYPVLDGLLQTWAATPDAAAAEIRVIGHRWSAPSFLVRDFLARNLVPYRWLLSDDPEAGRLLSRGRADRGRGAGGVHRRRQDAGARRARRSWPRTSGWPPARPRTSTTWSSSAAGRPGWAPRSTPRPRGCARCWWRRRRPAARPGRARGSRTTSASRTGSPARS